MTDTLTTAENLKEAGFSDAQATALTRAIEAVANAKAELLEASMNKDLAAVIERSDARFDKINAETNANNARLEAAIEKTARSQTVWFATIVFSAIGVLVALSGVAAAIVLHFR